MIYHPLEAISPLQCAQTCAGINGFRATRHALITERHKLLLCYNNYVVFSMFDVDERDLQFFRGRLNGYSALTDR